MKTVMVTGMDAKRSVPGFQTFKGKKLAYFAVTKPLGWDGEKLRGWSVTHIKSGCKANIYIIPNKAEAFAFALELELAGGKLWERIPEDVQAMKKLGELTIQVRQRRELESRNMFRGSRA